MKHSIPAATFATLLSSKSVLSKSDTIFYTGLATKTDSEIEIELLRHSWEQKSLHFKQKAKQRVATKKRLLLAFHEASRETFLVTTGKLCDPTNIVDVGIFNCPINQFCIEDSGSSLGGVCAKVAHKSVDVAYAKEGKVEAVVGKGGMDGRGGGDKDTVQMEPKAKVGVAEGLDGTKNKVVIEGDKNMASTDGKLYNDEGRGYTNKLGGTAVSGSVGSNFDANVKPKGENPINDTDDVDETEAGSGVKHLLPSTLKNKMKADRILKGRNSGRGEYLSLIDGECKLGTNGGYVDVGIFNGCSNGYLCAKDPYSNIGGTCVNIGDTADMLELSTDVFNGGKHRHLLVCNYLNGTSGEKCSGLSACGDLSPDFIANNIGCGSCNAFGACRGLTATSSVGENSCNGENSCRGGDHSAAVLTIKDKSCNYYYACSYSQGYTFIYDDSCNGIYSCMGLQGNSTISQESCNKDGACSDMSGNTTIGFSSCNECYSCTSTSGVTSISDESCNDLMSCSETSGQTSISSQSCNAAYSCSVVSGTTVIGVGSCNKAGACINGTGAFTYVGRNCCNGEKACEHVASVNLTLVQDSCNKKSACKDASGNDILIDGGCTGDGACSYISADYVRIHSGCNANYACKGINSGFISIGNESCSSNDACKDLNGIINFGQYSCVAREACSKASGIVTIQDNSCRGNYACREVSGNAVIYHDSCNSRWACRNISGTAIIRSSSCNGGNSCNYMSGKTTIYPDSCSATWACSFAAVNTTIQSLSCNGDSACRKTSGTTFVDEGSCNDVGACALLYGSTTIGASSCNAQLACCAVIGTTTIDRYSCLGTWACSRTNNFTSIGKHSCNASYACYNLTDHVSVLDESCDSPRSCSELSFSSTIGTRSCLNVNACRGSQALVVDSSSCIGVSSCSFMKGSAQISSSSCIGVSACSRLSNDYTTISEGSCVGVGACSRFSGTSAIIYDNDDSQLGQDDFFGLDDYFDWDLGWDDIFGWWEDDILGWWDDDSQSYQQLSTFAVGSGSCSGCYACMNSTAGLIEIGDGSCLGFSACEELSGGNVTIGNDSCYGLKVCSDVTNTSTIIIGDESCSGARSCMSISGYSVVSNSSCVDAQACKDMYNGKVGYHSCIGRSACFGFEGTVDSWSCQGYNSCKNAGNSTTNSIGHNSCNAAYACQDNAALIGDCLCLNANECEGNTIPIDYDGCAPSSLPSTSSFPTSSHSPTSSPIIPPTDLPSTSVDMSEAPSVYTGPQIALFDNNFGTPRCESITTSCDTGSLVVGRGAMSPSEPNHPNTIDGCADGNSGSFHSAESLDRIIVKSNDPQPDVVLKAGGNATITATVYSWSTFTDHADFFYAANASKVDWKYIGSVKPSKSGLADITMTYTLPAGAENQAVRVQFRYEQFGSSPSTNPCFTGNYNDRDDLVFMVVIPSPTLSPSPKPSLAPLIIHSDSPSETHSTIPSLLSSQSPSTSPSQTKSIEPSTMHSHTPSDTHSVAPSLFTSQSPSTNPSRTPSQTCFHKGQKIKIEATTQEAIQVFEVQVMSENINVALGKTATQSSTFRSNDGKFGANNAVDGDSGTFIHTESTSAWWMVDLEALFSVESISILNRWCKDSTDPHGCLCRLSNASVSLLDGNNDTVAAFSTTDTCGTSEIVHSFITPCLTASPSASATSLACLPNARTVKLYQPITGLPIHVLEVKAMNASNANIAQGGTATQSSTFMDDQDKFGANNAVDGDSTTFTHTKSESNPWWQVDLGDNYDISSIEILNRWCKDLNDSANCLCRLSGATISLVDDSGTEFTSISTGNTCGQVNLEFVFESSPQFCRSTSSHNILHSQQRTERLLHKRVLKKRPTKC